MTVVQISRDIKKCLLYSTLLMVKYMTVEEINHDSVFKKAE